MGSQMCQFTRNVITLCGFGVIAIAGLFTATSAQAQTITGLSIVDDSSTPLLLGDNGIRFGYSTALCGDLSVYLRCSKLSFTLLTSKREFRGPGHIDLSSRRLAHLCRTEVDFATCSLVVTHVTCRTSEFSQVFLPMKLDILAPYGCDPQPLPAEPSHLPTNLTLRKTRPEAAIGFGLGCTMIIAGIVQEQAFLDVDGGEGKVEDARLMMVLGVVAVGICYKAIFEHVPDYEKNRSNRGRNDRAQRTWRAQLENVRHRNELITSTFKVRVVSFD